MDKKNIPNVYLQDWITIGAGKGLSKQHAVVCKVYSNKEGEIEVVYLNGKKAIHEDVVWTGEIWDFKKGGPNGGYADDDSSLAEYVATLRAGYHGK